MFSNGPRAAVHVIVLWAAVGVGATELEAAQAHQRQQEQQPAAAGTAPAMSHDRSPHHQHDQHQQHAHASQTAEALDRRGDRVMGFSHEKSAHHFRLASDGGRIEVTATDAADEATIAAIRSHLQEIAAKFARGEFDQPHAIHERELPGVAVLRAQREAVSYRYEKIPHGGRVRVISRNALATHAVHEFLRAQIADHRTGDPTTVEADPAPPLR